MHHQVLVVDDDPVAVEIACDLLRELGLTQHAAGNWSEMNEVLFSNQISAVLLDVKLPGLNGDVLAEFIQRNLDPTPKIVLYSSLEEFELRRLARRVGAVGMVLKSQAEQTMVPAIHAALTAFEADLDPIDRSESDWPPAADPISVPPDLAATERPLERTAAPAKPGTANQDASGSGS